MANVTTTPEEIARAKFRRIERHQMRIERRIAKKKIIKHARKILIFSAGLPGLGKKR